MDSSVELVDINALVSNGVSSKSTEQLIIMLRDEKITIDGLFKTLGNYLELKTTRSEVINTIIIPRTDDSSVDCNTTINEANTNTDAKAVDTAMAFRAKSVARTKERARVKAEATISNVKDTTSTRPSARERYKSKKETTSAQQPFELIQDVSYQDIESFTWNLLKQLVSTKHKTFAISWVKDKNFPVKDLIYNEFKDSKISVVELLDFVKSFDIFQNNPTYIWGLLNQLLCTKDHKDHKDQVIDWLRKDENKLPQTTIAAILPYLNSLSATKDSLTDTNYVKCDDTVESIIFLLNTNIISVEDLLGCSSKKISITDMLWQFPTLISVLEEKNLDCLKAHISSCSVGFIFLTFNQVKAETQSKEFSVDGYNNFFALVKKHNIILPANSINQFKMVFDDFFKIVNLMNPEKVKIMDKLAPILIEIIDVLIKSDTDNNVYNKTYGMANSGFSGIPNTSKLISYTPLQACIIRGFDKLTEKLLTIPSIQCAPILERGPFTYYSLLGYSTNITTPLSVYASKLDTPKLQELREQTARLSEKIQEENKKIQERNKRIPYARLVQFFVKRCRRTEGDTSVLLKYNTREENHKIQARSRKINARATIEELVNRKDPNNKNQSDTIDLFVNILNEAIRQKTQTERIRYLEDNSGELKKLLQVLQKTSLGASALNAILAVFAYCGCVFLSPFGFKCDSFLFYKNGDKQKAEEALNLVETYGAYVSI